MSELIYSQHSDRSLAKNPAIESSPTLFPNRVSNNEPPDDGRWALTWRTPWECETSSKVLGYRIKKQIKGALKSDHESRSCE